MRFRNVARRVLKLQSCERVGQVVPHWNTFVIRQAGTMVQVLGLEPTILTIRAPTIFPFLYCYKHFVFSLETQLTPYLCNTNQGEKYLRKYLAFSGLSAASLYNCLFLLLCFVFVYVYIPMCDFG